MGEPERLLFFGDSLSDSGNAFALSGAVLKVAIPPASAGYAGWFSNGPVQSEVTADLLGASLDNFAVGGARAIGSRTVAEYLAQNGYDTPDILAPDPDPAALATDTYLGGQLGRYLAGAAAHPPAAGTAAAIWIGANDYNNLPPDASPELVAQTITGVVGNTILAAGAIAATGVGRILVYNLPEPAFLPVPLPDGFDQVVAAHNAGLARGVALLGAGNVDAAIVDMHRMSVEIDSDPRAFGLDPGLMDQPLRLGIASQPAWDAAAQDWVIPANPVVAGVDPDRVAFMDFLHPSSATHGVLGSFAAASIGGNPVFGGSGDETIRTRWHDDLVLAGAGDDRVTTKMGPDIVLAGLGDDFVWAGPGRDIVVGGAGDDRLRGGAGADVIAGSDGADVAGGGAGRDLLIDGLGHDLVRAGAGDDAILYTEAARLGGSNPDDGGFFDGGCGFDTLYLALGDATRAAVEAELRDGRAAQSLEAIGVTTRSVEAYVFVDPDDPAAGILTGARLAEADLWGLV